MADGTTTTYGLTKPEVGSSEDTWGEKINGVFDDLDDLLDGTTPVTGIDINSGTIDGITSLTVSGDVAIDTDTLFVDASENRVGIGTVSPTNELHIASSGVLLKLEDTSNAATSQINFADADDGNVGKLVYDHSDNSMAFTANNSEAMRIDSSGRLGIGTTSPEHILHVYQDGADTNAKLLIEAGGTGNSDADLELKSDDSNSGRVRFLDDTGEGGRIEYNHASDFLAFDVNGSEAMRILSSGDLETINSILDPSGETHGSSIVTTNVASGTNFTGLTNPRLELAGTGAIGLIRLNLRSINDDYIQFRKNGSLIGDIDTTDGSTVRYRTFTGGHWAQFEDFSQPDLLYGTVVSTIDQRLQWSTVEVDMGIHTANDEETGEIIETQRKHRQEVAGTLEIGSTVTIQHEEFGEDVQGTVVKNSTSPILCKIKVSDQEADPTVYGIWTNSYRDGDVGVDSVGTSRIRIGSGVTVQRGDLLESAGDGTARPQTGDTADLFKAGTIAKVTSTTVVETYDDGSYTVPCTLHCG